MCNLPVSSAGLCGFLQRRWWSMLTWNGCTFPLWYQRSAALVIVRYAGIVSGSASMNLGRFRTIQHFYNLFCSSLHWVFDLLREETKEKQYRRNYSSVGWWSSCLLTHSVWSSWAVICFEKWILRSVVVYYVPHIYWLHLTWWKSHIIQTLQPWIWSFLSDLWQLREPGFIGYTPSWYPPQIYKLLIHLKLLDKQIQARLKSRWRRWKK
jgi:hypothetical protein